MYGSTDKRHLLTGNGIENWNDKDAWFITYVRINTPGTMQVKLKGKTNQPCKLEMSIAGKKQPVNISQADFQWTNVG